MTGIDGLVLLHRSRNGTLASLRRRREELLDKIQFNQKPAISFVDGVKVMPSPQLSSLPHLPSLSLLLLSLLSPSSLSLHPSVVSSTA